jgi:hypothetical protein
MSIVRAALFLSAVTCFGAEVLENENCTSEEVVDDEADGMKASLVQLRHTSNAYTIAEDYHNSTLIPDEFADLHTIEMGEDVGMLQTETPGTLVGQWVDLGAGCCQTRVKPLFNGRVQDSKACIAKAELLYGGFILYGWLANPWCTVYPREAQCTREAYRATGPGDCNMGGAIGGGTGVHTLELFSFMDLGKGCCQPNPNMKVVFNGRMQYNDGKPGDLRACMQMCEWTHFGDCGYVMFGWSAAPTWCTIYSKDTHCSKLDSGPTDCGSSGNTGVHVFHFLSNCGKCDVLR